MFSSRSSMEAMSRSATSRRWPRAPRAPVSDLGAEPGRAGLEARRRGHQPLLKQSLDVAEPGESQELGKPHEAGRMDSALLSQGGDRVRRHLIGVLRQVLGDELVGLAHGLVVLVHVPYQDFVTRGHYASFHNALPAGKEPIKPTISVNHVASRLRLAGSLGSERQVAPRWGSAGPNQGQMGSSASIGPGPKSIRVRRRR